MGRKHVNRRGKTSRGAKKTAFRSHDPEYNPTFLEKMYVGRNAAPPKGDHSVEKTVLNVKVRENAEPKEAALAPMVQQRSQDKHDRHAEMKRKGDEKKRLLAANALKVAPGLVQAAQPVQPSESLAKPKRAPVAKEPRVFKDSPVPENIAAKSNKKRKRDPSKDGPLVPSKKSAHASDDLTDTNKYARTDNKRKKMRDRERAKREKLREKKERKASKRPVKSIANKPKFNEVMDRPSESIQELGKKLAAKLEKNSDKLKSAYDLISKASNKLQD